MICHIIQTARQKSPIQNSEAAEDAHGAAQPIPYHVRGSDIERGIIALRRSQIRRPSLDLAHHQLLTPRESNRHSRDGRHSVSHRLV